MLWGLLHISQLWEDNYFEWNNKLRSIYRALERSAKLLWGILASLTLAWEIYVVDGTFPCVLGLQPWKFLFGFQHVKVTHFETHNWLWENIYWMCTIAPSWHLRSSLVPFKTNMNFLLLLETTISCSLEEIVLFLADRRWVFVWDYIWQL